MALAFNDRLKTVGHGEFVPVGVAANASPDDDLPGYDIDAAVQAVSTDLDG